jgi:hypothetical protein
MARIGSVAAAPFVGDQFVSLYVGATRVPTVPGKPEWDGTPPASGGEFDFAVQAQGVPAGGSTITGFNIYLDGVLFGSADAISGQVVIEPEAVGVYEIAVAAVNAVGEGPWLIHTYDFVGV